MLILTTKWDDWAQKKKKMLKSCPRERDTTFFIALKNYEV